MYQISTEQFQGPFDVLLSLIEKRELDITELSLADIADDFVAYIDNHDIQTQELVDFLKAAVTLLYMKARELVPTTPEEEEKEEDVRELQERLRQYKKYRDATKQIEILLAKKRFTFERRQPKQDKSAIQPHFIAPPGVTQEIMHHFYKNVIERLKSFVIIPKATIKRMVSLHDIMMRLKDILGKKKKTSLFSEVSKKSSKDAYIAHFLSALELEKQRVVTLEQEQPFHDIILTRIN